MQTRTPHWHRLVFPIAFALGCIVVTLLILRSFGAPTPLEPKGYRVDVPLPRALNLVPGSDVQVSGVDVGRVVATRREENRALATIQLQSRFAPLPAGSTVIVRAKTLLGEAYLDLSLGRKHDPPVPEGGRLASSRAAPSVTLDEFLSTFDRKTRRDTRRLLAGSAAALDGRAGALNAALGELAPLSGAFDDVMAALAGQRQDLGGVVRHLGSILDVLAHREGVLKAAVTNGDRLFDVTAQRDARLAAIVHELPGFLRELDRTATTVVAATPDLDAAIGALEPAAALAQPALAGIRGAAPELTGIFRRLPPLTAASRTGLPAFERIATALRGGFKAFHPAARELVPFMQLLGLNARSVLALFANVGQLTAGRFVAPDGRVRAYGGGFVTLWNESVGGWKTKLPTNRQNPYPKSPDALLDTGRIGTLKAFDCRNADNPAVLPPTGTGSPPCIEQGPWSFQNQLAYYPKLEPAAP